MEDQANRTEEATLEEIMRAVTDRTDLTDAPLAVLMAYALTPDDQDPLLGWFQGVRDELCFFADLIQRCHATVDIDVSRVGGVLDGLGRRLAVATELLERRTRPARREPSTDAPPASS